MSAGPTPDRSTPSLDPRRWVTLAIVITSIFIVVLDNSVLNVAIPTILRDFHTSLPSLEWVVTGYALVFATFLIIGGRLGDLYGHRRVFVVGAALFGAGSSLASVSRSVPILILGEAIIEGIGASMMLPSTLAILSTTFRGRERATAFAAWGTTAGAAAAFGPVVGGFLTTDYSWRWAFRINVIVAPFAIIGALLFVHKGAPADRRSRIDLPGAALVATGMFLLVFGLTEGGTYGWLRPVKDFAVAGWRWWPASRPVSVIPLAFVAGAAILCGFYALERAKERHQQGPLFEFGQLRSKGFRYGLLATAMLAVGQLGLLFALPVFLQDGKHLSAERNGLWVLPAGLLIIAGAQLGGRLTRRIGTTVVVRLGLALETVGLAVVAVSISPQVGFFGLLPGLSLYGLGIGLASSQLTNVVLSDIDQDKSGVASGANTTVRQVGSALGVAVIGSLLTAQTIRHTTGQLTASPALQAALKARATASARALGPNFRPPAGATPGQVTTIGHALAVGVAAGTRPALLFAAGVVMLGTLVSLLIPTVEPAGKSLAATTAAGETFDAVEHVERHPAAIVAAQRLEGAHRAGGRADRRGRLTVGAIAPKESS